MTSNYDVCLSPVLEERRYMSKSTLDRGVLREVKIDEQRIYIRQTCKNYGLIDYHKEP
jgi:hypothetical protein